MSVVVCKGSTGSKSINEVKTNKKHTNLRSDLIAYLLNLVCPRRPDLTSIVLTSFIKHRTGTALSDDNGRTLVTTAPWSGGRKHTALRSD